MNDIVRPSIVERMKGHATYGYMPSAIREVMAEAASHIEALEAELAEARSKVEKVREDALEEVARHLSAVQYDPAPYTAMKYRLASLAKDGPAG